jgi:hypothetical protein
VSRLARRVAAAVAAALTVGTLALTRNVGLTVTPRSTTPSTVVLER